MPAPGNASLSGPWTSDLRQKMLVLWPGSGGMCVPCGEKREFKMEVGPRGLGRGAESSNPCSGLIIDPQNIYDLIPSM